MTDTVIAEVSRARLALDAATTAAEVKLVLDAAQAAFVYAKRQKLTVETIQQVYAIQIDSMVKLGELLDPILNHQGGRPRNGSSEEPFSAPSLRELGITKKESFVCQSLAAATESEIFEVKAGRLKLTQAVHLVRQRKQKSKAKSVKSTDGGIFVKSLDELIGRTFGCIYADPPWRYDNQGTRSSTKTQYSTMTVDDLCKWPVKDFAAPKAHLHLWITNAFLFDAPRIFEAWGFEFKSSYVWCKPQMGIGNYWRNSHEILLLGTRGKLVGQHKGLKSWGEFRRERHSEKPEAIRRLVEKLSPPDYLELFGRKMIPNWTVLGNELITHQQDLVIEA